jgi:hypothetical protein
MIYPVFFLEVAVRRTVPSLVSVALCILLAGCAPQGSLFPVYTSDDVYFDESLDGSWRTMDSDQKSDDDLHLSFREIKTVGPTS